MPALRPRVAATLFVLAIALTAGCVSVSVDVRSPSGDAGRPADGPGVTVVRVVDGDTVRVEYPNGTRETVRLLGVDTPEVTARNTPGEYEGVPDTRAGKNCLQAWGRRASAFASDRLLGREVTLRFDPAADRRDRYGRLLAYVVVGGEPFGRALVERGYARVYDSGFAYSEAYYRLEAAAQRERRGLWQCRDPRAASAGGPRARAGGRVTRGRFAGWTVGNGRSRVILVARGPPRTYRSVRSRAGG